MAMRVDEFQLLRDRVENVEMRCRLLHRQNRRMRLALIVLPLIAGTAGAALQDRDITSRTVTTERLVIRDPEGRDRAVLGYLEEPAKRTSLELYGEDGARRVSLNVLGNGAASIYLHYPNGKMFSFGWVTPGGDGKGMPNFTFRGPDGEVYATLMGKTDSASPSFEVFSGEPGRSRLLEKLGGARP